MSHLLDSKTLASYLPAIAKALKAKGFMVKKGMYAVSALDRDHFRILDVDNNTLGLGQVNPDGSLVLIIPEAN